SFDIAWEAGSGIDADGDGNAIFARRFAANGTPLSGDFLVNTYTTSHQQWPALAVAPDGSFAVTWMSLGQDGSGEGVYAQRYAADGTPVGAEFRANSYTTGDQYIPAIGVDAAGDLVIAWSDYSDQPDDPDGVRMALFPGSGSGGGSSDTRVNTSTLG